MTLLVRGAADVPSDAALRDVSGIAIFGGDFCLNEPPSWLEREIRFIRGALDRGFPVFGHGVGGSILAQAAGGGVHRIAGPEIGWLPLSLRPEAARTPWLDRLSGVAHLAFMRHTDAFETPPGAVPLLSSTLSPCQAFALDGSIGVRFHPEVTHAILREWLPKIVERLPPPSITVQTAAELETDVSRKITAGRELSAVFYRYWATQLDVRSRAY
jgi:GMP synthase (glutamine-hydrolysing)